MKSVREARARHRRSTEGRDDHRDRMRDRRRRQRDRVMDQRSARPVATAKVTPSKEVTDGREKVQRLPMPEACIVCGRQSRWTHWYPSRCWGRTPSG